MTYSPHDLLPVDLPSKQTYKNDLAFFYNNVVHHLVPDIIRITSNGIPIDLEKIKELEKVVNDVLVSVSNRLTQNPLMQDFLIHSKKVEIIKETEKLQGKQKDYTQFLKEFDFKNKTHRSYVVNTYLKSINKYEEFYQEEWSVNDLKKVNTILKSSFIYSLLDKSLSIHDSIVLEAMEELANTKADIYNKSHCNDKIELLEDKIEIVFNPASNKMVAEFFEYLGIESEELTKAGNDSWGKKQIENLLKLVTLLIEQDE